MQLPKVHFPKLSSKNKEIGLFLIIIGSILNNTLLYINLLNENQTLSYKVDQYSLALSNVQGYLNLKINENSNLSQNLKTEKETNQKFQNQIEGIKGTVGVLEKLSQTDPELLKKYSKIYFLNENYTPKILVNIDSKYLLEPARVIQFQAQAWPYLQRLLDDAKNSGVDVLILSAFRSFGTQANLKSSYLVTYGSGANKFSADQGYSEHQLGTTLDFTTTKIGSVLTGFEKTDAYAWLVNNGYKYGFVMSYPKENTYYIFEPWHWRYVGVELATKLHQDNIYFYALEQRVIDSYLIGLFP